MQWIRKNALASVEFQNPSIRLSGQTERCSSGALHTVQAVSTEMIENIPCVSKSNRLHVVIFRFSLDHLRYIP
jgi:hypothetical protein